MHITVDLNINISSPDIERTLRQIMAAIDDLKKAQAAEKADLATLAGLITQLLTAFANGTLSPADASALVTEMNAQDSTVQSNITSIKAVLNPPVGP